MEFIITILQVLGVITALCSLLIAGIRWSSSGGNSEKVIGAKNHITYAVVGLIVILSAVLIVSLLFGGFGLKLEY